MSMTVTAHSGAFDTPDNSLVFLCTVLEKGCEILEMDVSFRPSGTPVMIHKESPAENEGVALEEAFALLAKDPEIKLNLDLKNISCLPSLEALLSDFGLKDRAFYTGVGKDWAETVRRTGTLPYYLNADVPVFRRKNEKTLLSLAEEIKSCGAIGLNCHYGNVTPETARVLHGAGLLLSVWTVNDERTAYRILACAPDNVTSRHPDMIWKAIEDQRSKIKDQR